MIEFIELNGAQKNYVVHVMKRFNHNKPDISLAEMKQYHDTMLQERDSGGPKLGYPNWLIKPHNKVSKSVYAFPIPTEDDMDDYRVGNVDARIIIERYSPMLQQVVKEYGLILQ